MRSHLPWALLHKLDVPSEVTIGDIGCKKETVWEGRTPTRTQKPQTAVGVLWGRLDSVLFALTFCQNVHKKLTEIVVNSHSMPFCL